ncbi:hypothetical protein FGO68_gene39 [Halteria grandinella]|uniref:Uncharacterized protein n=1 Tax=Halteria grandinella TaxID=5974 RepID=A0A8J8NVM3_HALGN|nr:hypothetical protein FGO68_gene39 [Halteria grandinella]
MEQVLEPNLKIKDIAHGVNTTWFSLQSDQIDQSLINELINLINYETQFILLFYLFLMEKSSKTHNLARPKRQQASVHAKKGSNSFVPTTQQLSSLNSVAQPSKASFSKFSSKIQHSPTANHEDFLRKSMLPSFTIGGAPQARNHPTVQCLRVEQSMMVGASIEDQANYGKSLSPSKPEIMITMSTYRKQSQPPQSTKHVNPYMEEKNPMKGSNMMRSTDFGSKGMYKPTSTIGGKTSLVNWLEQNEARADQSRISQDTINFRETANLKLSGSTFDSKHITNFMQDCPFALRASPPHTGFLKKHSSKEKTLPMMRLSGCFSSIDRENKGQMRVFFDQYNGPSSMMRFDDTTVERLSNNSRALGMPPTSKSVMGNYQGIGETYKSFLQSSETVEASRIVDAKQRREELFKIRDQLKLHREAKERHFKLNKLDRIIKSEWKYGVLGQNNTHEGSHTSLGHRQPEVELAAYNDDHQGEQTALKSANFKESTMYRIKKMLKFGGVTNQVHFARPEEPSKNDPRSQLQGRVQSKVIDIDPDWTTKKISPVRFHDTHSRVFERQELSKEKQEHARVRLENIKQSELRGRHYNFLNNDSFKTLNIYGSASNEDGQVNL